MNSDKWSVLYLIDDYSNTVNKLHSIIVVGWVLTILVLHIVGVHQTELFSLIRLEYSIWGFSPLRPPIMTHKVVWQV